VLALSLFLPAPAAAGQIVIGPAKLRAESNVEQDTRLPFAVASRTAGPAHFWAPVRLPLGAVVKRLVYQHARGGAAGETSVELKRAGSFGDQFLVETVATGWSDQVTGGPYRFVNVVTTPSSSRRKIAPGWRYGVEVTAVGTDAAVGWVKIVYE